MTKTHYFIVILLLMVVVAGCKDRNQPGGTSSSTTNSRPEMSTPAPSASNNVTDQWVGKWIGPEGTYLVLSKNGDKYVVEIHSLDGPATYDGTSIGDRIEFQRKGRTEFIHAGSGQETGMKWLLDHRNCLIISTGEGFCRD